MAESASIRSRILTHSCWKICAWIWTQKFWKIGHSRLKMCGWNLQYLFLNPVIFVLEDLCLNLHAKVLEYYPFVLEDMWLNPGTFVAESWDIRGRSLSGWIRYVLESEFVPGFTHLLLTHGTSKALHCHSPASLLPRWSRGRAVVKVGNNCPTSMAHPSSTSAWPTWKTRGPRGIDTHHGTLLCKTIPFARLKHHLFTTFSATWGNYIPPPTPPILTSFANNNQPASQLAFVI